MTRFGIGIFFEVLNNRIYLIFFIFLIINGTNANIISSKKWILNMAHDTVSKEALLDRINLLERKLGRFRKNR